MVPPETDLAARLESLQVGLTEATTAATTATAASREAVAETERLIAHGQAVNVERWSRYSRRTRRLLYGVLVSLVLNLCIGGFVVWNQHRIGRLAHQARIAAGKAQSVHNSLITQCEAGNQFRADDKALWDKVISLSSTANQTAAQRQTTAEFQAFIAMHDAPKDCTKIP